MQKSQALVVNSQGQIEFDESWHVPSPSSDELKLRVTACGLNFADLLMIKGTYQDTPTPPFALGLEVAGIVEQIGSNVTGFRIGQRVAALCRGGGLSSQLTVPAQRCRSIPDTIDDITAAGFQIAYGTSHLALLRRANLNADDILVVLGASGGVGLTAVEIGKAVGAKVIAVAQGREKLSIAQEMGANVLVDSSEDDLVSTLKQAGPPSVVYDAVGGSQGEAALRALQPEGRHLLIGFASGSLPELKPNHMLVKNTSVIGVNWGAYLQFNPSALTDSLEELLGWHAEGKITPFIGHIFPFERALESLELMRKRESKGKIVITL